MTFSSTWQNFIQEFFDLHFSGNCHEFSGADHGFEVDDHVFERYSHEFSDDPCYCDLILMVIQTYQRFI